MGLLDAPVKDDRTGLYVPKSSASRHTTPPKVLWQEDLRAHPLGLWNDGAGDAYRDCDIMHSGRPSLRLDTQGQSAGGATSPGRTAATAGVVVKRRLHDSFSGVFAMDCWFRFTGSNNNGTTTPFFSMSIYNRTGTDPADGTSYAHHGRLWLNQAGNNVNLKAQILDGVATNAANGGGTTGQSGTQTAWPTIYTSRYQNGAGSHTWQPEAASGRLDRAGGWHYAYLAVDLAAKKYVGCRVDSGAFVDLSSYSLDTTTSTGFGGMHFSFEYSANTTTRRYMNVAAITGYGS